MSWIVDDQVRVAARLDRAFTREKVEDFRRVGAGDLYEGVQIKLAGLDTVRVENAGMPFGILVKSSRPITF
jgi:hypothetical protein